MSQYLVDTALQSRQWKAQAARGSAGHHNAFVAATLSEPAFLRRLAMPFEGAPFTVVGASVEKVLVGPASRHSTANRGASAKVPFDAQVWLRLAPK